MIKTVCMQSLINDIECQIFHYLHNLCDNEKLNKFTLYQKELAKTIIPECLRLGYTCFTHMSVFGTVSKQDGEMPIHYNKRDIISCVFHLGEAIDGGNTSYCVILYCTVILLVISLKMEFQLLKLELRLEKKFHCHCFAIQLLKYPLLILNFKFKSMYQKRNML